MSGKTKCLNRSLVLQHIQLLLVVAISLVLSSCGSSSEDQSSAVAPSAKIHTSMGSFSDSEIANALYKDIRVPEGFYKEPSNTSLYSVISHLKNTDIVPVASRAGMAQHELSSDDFIEAMNWSETSESYQSTYKHLVNNSETSTYHQFERVDSASPEISYVHRVMKASLIDRTGVNDSYLGRVTKPDFSETDIINLLEYLWTFSIDNNYGNAIVSTKATVSATEIKYTMLHASMTMSFDASCDQISVSEVNYKVSKSSGFISKESQLLHQFESIREGDHFSLCE